MQQDSNEIKPGAQTRQVAERVEQLLRSWEGMAEALTAAEQTIRQRFDVVRSRMAYEQLHDIPLDRLKEATESRLSIAPLERAGYRSIADVLNAGEARLRSVRGVGEMTAIHAVGAARQLLSVVLDGLRFRLDPDAKRPDETALLAAVRAHGALEGLLPSLLQDIDEVTHAAERVRAQAAPGMKRWGLWFKSDDVKATVAQATAALSRIPRSPKPKSIEEQVRRVRGLLEAKPDWWPDLWGYFEGHAAQVYARLAELADLNLDVDAAQGHLPAEIVAAVEQQALDETFLQVSLRGYQAFGARYALVQRRTMLGDEMGLGKTVTALAAMAHLRALDANAFFVVCPASVLYNWSHELTRKSRLRPWIVHGIDRERQLAGWRERGGVALTTFGTLGALPPPNGDRVAMMVVDEAHYVKNPEAKRSMAVAEWSDHADRVLFMTGTPMENRLDEFRRLVDYLQPDLSWSISGVHAVAGPAAFRESVAPVYLRRNQDDVLTELPERIEMEDWVELSSADMLKYRDAVRSKNFMAMRRAAFAATSTATSAKAERLREIVHESFESGWKVVVFSYFRDVLSAVADSLPGTVYGPLTGSLSAPARLALVDEFSSHEGPAVLVSQIEAGGVGMNMQAASVVVLCEPQWKPSTEVQAIARCHRMGQTRPVRVHRLLAMDSVDQRMLEILSGKAALFDAYVRDSAVAAASASAVDISETEAARRIIDEERRRLEISRRPERGRCSVLR